MASLAGLVREHTSLDREQVSHLNRLTSEWGLLADLSFSDLLLYVPTKDDRWLIIGQIRPATGQTVYRTDWVGTFANTTEQTVLDRRAQHRARSPRATSPSRSRTTRRGCSPSRCATATTRSP